MPRWRREDRINLDQMRKERVEKLCGEMKREGIGTCLCLDPSKEKYCHCA